MSIMTCMCQTIARFHSIRDSQSHKRHFIVTYSVYLTVSTITTLESSIFETLQNRKDILILKCPFTLKQWNFMLT